MEDLEAYWPDTGPDETGIFFTFHEVDFPLAEAPRLVQWIDETAQEEGFEVTRIDYIFCQDDYLLEVNRAHLDHDDYTDIITFPLNTNPIMAEIYISIDRVKENAAALAVAFQDELRRVMIHGVLHLCGYEDAEEEDKRLIRKKEDAYLLRYDEV